MRFMPFILVSCLPLKPLCYFNYPMAELEFDGHLPVFGDFSRQIRVKKFQNRFIGQPVFFKNRKFDG